MVVKGKFESTGTSSKYVSPSMEVVAMKQKCSILTGSTIEENGNIPSLTNDEAEW